MASRPALFVVNGLSGQRAGNEVATSALDERVGRALAAVEARPEERWTVARLAKIAGLSRAAFARRFAAEVGVPPLQHVTAVRMRRAAEMLAETEASLAEIAVSVGYASEFALSRAFHRLVGVPPGAYRRLGHGVRSSSRPRCLAA